MTTKLENILVLNGHIGIIDMNDIFSRYSFYRRGKIFSHSIKLVVSNKSLHNGVQITCWFHSSKILLKTLFLDLFLQPSFD
jgi:hypothetical protein